MTAKMSPSMLDAVVSEITARRQHKLLIALAEDMPVDRETRRCMMLLVETAYRDPKAVQIACRKRVDLWKSEGLL